MPDEAIRVTIAERFTQFSEALTPEPPMKVTLKDGAPRSVGHVDINVSKNGNTVEIGAAGVDPAPIVLEFYNGKLTLRLFGEEGQPTVSQVITTVPTVKTEPAVVSSKPSAPVQTAQEAVNAAFPPPAPPAEFDEAAFDAA